MNCKSENKNIRKLAKSDKSRWPQPSRAISW